MHLIIICGLFVTKFSMLFASGDYDEKIHFKIHVPEFINHHHHTKIIYVHDKPSSKPTEHHVHHHIHKDCDEDKKNHGHLHVEHREPFKPVYPDSKPKYHDSYGNVVKDINLNVGVNINKDKFPETITLPKTQFVPEIRLVKTHVIVPESPPKLLSLPNYNNQQNDYELDEFNKNTRFQPSQELVKPKAEISYNNDYNKFADAFEKKHEAENIRDALEKQNDYNKHTDDLRSKVVVYNIKPFVENDNVNIVNKLKAIKNQKVEFQSIKTSAPDSGSTFGYTGGFEYTTPSPIHTYFYPNTADVVAKDEVEEEDEEEEKKSYEEYSYEQHISPYHNYFPESHKQKILESEIEQHFENMKSPQHYFNDGYDIRNELNVESLGGYEQFSNDAGGDYGSNYDHNNYNANLASLGDLNTHSNLAEEFANLNSNYDYDQYKRNVQSRNIHSTL